MHLLILIMNLIIICLLMFVFLMDFSTINKHIIKNIFNIETAIALMIYAIKNALTDNSK